MKMKHISAAEIKEMDRIQRLNLVNSVPGFKSANLIGSRDSEGNTNLAVFSSVIHLGSDPALLGCIVRPDTVQRDTLSNIRTTRAYTINHIHQTWTDRAHYTSARFSKEISEFSACELTEQYLVDHPAPFVAESFMKLGVILKEEIPIPSNGTILLVGEIEHVILPEKTINEDGSLDLNRIGTVAISGLDQYHECNRLAQYPYAKADSLPDFQPIDMGGKKRPDNVVYNEDTKSYDASLKAYPTDLGAPVFDAGETALWKNASSLKISHHFEQRLKEIKSEYEDMMEEVRWNEIVYKARFNFEPVVGETYHLYKGKRGDDFLSMIDPGQWRKEHLGSFQLSSDRMWKQVAAPVS